MEIRLKPETESRLNELASKSGRPTGELVEDAMVGYLAEVAEVRSILDRVEKPSADPKSPTLTNRAPFDAAQDKRPGALGKPAGKPTCAKTSAGRPWAK